MWIAHTNGDLQSGFEIVVIQDNYGHGFNSWGWYSPEKKILIAEVDECEKLDILEDDFLKYQQMAKIIAKALNKEYKIQQKKVRNSTCA